MSVPDCILPSTSMSKKEIELSPKLIIKIQESRTLEKGASYIINACGYIDSQRKLNDGCVYIGTNDTKSNRKEINDIIIPKEERGMGARHILIRFILETRSYYIKDNGDGTGTFIKIEKSLVLRTGYIISYGDSHMVVTILESKDIQLKFLDGPKADQILYFNYILLNF